MSNRFQLARRSFPAYFRVAALQTNIISTV